MIDIPQTDLLGEFTHQEIEILAVFSIQTILIKCNFSKVQQVTSNSKFNGLLGCCFQCSLKNMIKYLSNTGGWEKPMMQGCWLRVNCAKSLLISVM